MSNVFLKPGHSLLRKVSKEIPKSQINSLQTLRIIQKMLKIAYGERKDSKKPIMVGLAAPQIGISKRIILVDTKADGKSKKESSPAGGLRVFINPQITWKSKRENEWYEGCFSTGQICGIVKRPVTVKVRAFEPTSQGWKLELRKYAGYVARIFQHEIDHLNGKVFIERIKDPNKLHKVLKKEFPLYRKKWRNWPKIYPFPLALRKLKKV